MGQTPALRIDDLLAPLAEVVREAAQATSTCIEGLGIHVILHLAHPPDEVPENFVQPVRCEIRLQQTADVGDDRLMEVRVPFGNQPVSSEPKSYDLTPSSHGKHLNLNSGKGG